MLTYSVSSFFIMYAVSFKEIKDSPVVKAAENLVKEINDSAPVSSIKATCKEIDEHRITSALKALITGYMSYWSFYMVYKALGKCGKNSIFHVAAAVGGMSTVDTGWVNTAGITSQKV